MKTAAVYARRSQEDPDASIEHQLAICAESASKAGYKVVAQFADDDVSGSIPFEDRPGGAAALEELTSGRVDAIWAKNQSRLGRPVEEGAGHVTRLYFFTKPYGDGIRLVEGATPDVSTPEGYAQSFSAEFADGMHILRTKVGVRTAQQKNWRLGNNAGGLVPYGIRWNRQSKFVGTWEIDKAEAKVVQRIYKLVLAGHSVEAIAKQLNRQHVPAPPQNDGHRRARAQWWPAIVWAIVRNPVYRGVRARKDGAFVIHHPKADTSDWEKAEEVERKDFPRVVTDAVWRRAQKALHGRATRQMEYKYRKGKWLGRVVCGAHGTDFIRRPNYNPLADGSVGTHHGDDRYYCRVKGCGSRKLWESEIAQYLTDVIRRLDNDPRELRKAVNARLRGVRAEIQTLERQAGPAVKSQEKLEARRQRVLDMYEDGSITREERQRREAEVNEKLRRVQEQVEGVEAVMSALRHLRGLRDYILHALKNLSDTSAGDLLRQAWKVREGDTRKAKGIVRAWLSARMLAGFATAVYAPADTQGKKVEELVRLLDLRVIVAGERVKVEGEGVIPLHSESRPNGCCGK